MIPGGADAHAAPPALSDVELVAALQRGEREAAGALVDRYGPLVNRLLLRTLGAGPDHDDRVQESFIECLRSVRSMRDGSMLRAWVTTITVRVARAELRRRRLRRWLTLSPSVESVAPEVSVDPDPESREALRAAWRLLDAMPTEERLAFTLRYVHGEELTAVAEAVGCSLATIKRRLTRAEARFREGAHADPALAPWVARGGRWGAP